MQKISKRKIAAVVENRAVDELPNCSKSCEKPTAVINNNFITTSKTEATNVPLTQKLETDLLTNLEKPKFEPPQSKFLECSKNQLKMSQVISLGWKLFIKLYLNPSIVLGASRAP